MQYPAPGAPQMAEAAAQLLQQANIPVQLDDKRGLDHGAWVPLSIMFPQADIPVVQLSMNEWQEPREHYELGRRLAALRAEGVLIVASGNLIHNLHTYSWRQKQVEPYEWAVDFERQVRELILAGDDQPLVNYQSLGSEAKLAAPTPEHYLPLLYLLGARQRDEAVAFPVEGVDGGSVSMLTAQVG